MKRSDGIDLKIFLDNAYIIWFCIENKIELDHICIIGSTLINYIVT